MGVFAGVCFYRQYLRHRVQRLNCYIPYSEDVDREQNFLVNSQFRDGPSGDALRLIAGDDDDDDGISEWVPDDSIQERWLMVLSFSEEVEGLRNVIKQMLERFQRSFDDPMKDVQSMESEMNALTADSINKNWFREEVEVKDDDDESYADIRIPDFRDGRQGRFIHDFKNNQTTIVDETAKRCFIYPLDYSTTMPPKSIIEVFKKMQTGYYFPDTTVLRQKMRVVLPELEKDDEYISDRTGQICENMKIYRLEPFVSGVYKRSVDSQLNQHALFAQYAGHNIVETDIVNMSEIEELEKKSK